VESETKSRQLADKGFRVVLTTRDHKAGTKAFLAFLSRADQARIINLSSGYGELGSLSSSVPSYCLSKLTLNGATIMFDEALRGVSVAFARQLAEAERIFQ
jgi:NAD(P)-dependent dehydrogenase (short-subunit alcohol dehydrogenase family)